MSRTFETLRKRLQRLKQSRVRVAAAQTRFRRDFRFEEFDPARIDRAARKLEEARQQLARAFDEGLSLLSGELVNIVSQEADQPAALEHILGLALERRVEQARRQRDRGHKHKLL